MHIKYPTTAVYLILEQKRKFEDIKWVIRSRNWKDRQLNGQKKRTKGQTTMYKNTTEKTKDRATRTPRKSGGELRCTVRVVSS